MLAEEDISLAVAKLLVQLGPLLTDAFVIRFNPCTAFIIVAGLSALLAYFMGKKL